MSYEEALKTISIESSTDLSASQYRIVDIDAAGQLVLVTAGAKMVGVLQDDPAATGRVGAVGIDGVTKVVSGGTVTAGERVSSDANGAAVTAATGDFSLGDALQSAVADDIFAVKIDIAQEN